MANHQTKIEKLINEFCPEGVEFKELGEVWKRAPKSKIGVGKIKLLDEGDIICFTSGSRNYKVNDFLVDGEYIFVNDGGVADFKYYNGKAYYTDHVFVFGFDLKIINTKFVYYFLKENQFFVNEKMFQGSGLKNLQRRLFEKFRIPIPPLEVQKEIVKILDNFTKLEAELEAELEARRRQYEYYRNKLLTFKNDEVEWKELGEILDYEQPTKYIVKSIKYSDKFQTPVLTAGKSFILGYTNENFGVFKANKKNPVIIFDDFTTSFHWVDFDFKIKSSALKIIKLRPRIDINFRFVYYAMKCIGFEAQDHARHWISKYSKFKIPIPPLEKQKQIVAILDKFDALVNDISSGLPVEIKARRQQYEYYRRKLLTFKEKK